MLEPSPLERPGSDIRDPAEVRPGARPATRDGRAHGIYEQSFDRRGPIEEGIGDALNTEAASWGGFGVLHRLVRPGGLDIDHIVVGPAGVLVLDAKNWSGSAWSGEHGIGKGRRPRAGVVDRLRMQVECVEAVLSHGGFAQVPVRGALCAANGTRGGTLGTIDDVHVGDTRAILELVRSGGALPLAEQRGVADVLARAFDVRGGKLLPTASTRVRSEGVVRAEQAARERAQAVRRRRRVWLWATCGVAGLLAAAAVALLVVGQVGGARPLSRQAVMAQQGHYRTLARRRAAGPLRGPRVVVSAAAFRLVYRGRGACRVTVVVPRGRGPAGARAPVLRARGCRGRTASSA